MGRVSWLDLLALDDCLSCGANRARGYDLILSSPTKTCQLDPIPCNLLKRVFSTLTPTVMDIINLSPSPGESSYSLKVAYSNTYPEKPSLNPDDLGNYRRFQPLSHRAGSCKSALYRYHYDYYYLPFLCHCEYKVLHDITSINPSVMY